MPLKERLMPYNITYMWNQKVSHTCGNCKKKKKKKKRERERQKEKEKKKKKANFIETENTFVVAKD